MSVLVLRAPLAGWCLALDEVPDPVFAQRMAGDGLAIDPTLGVLHAPCDGEVVTMGNARHAVTVRAAGVDILMHVGIDTVELDGFGFELLVAAGQRVRSGEPLLRFDMGELARRAKSLASPSSSRPADRRAARGGRRRRGGRFPDGSDHRAGGRRVPHADRATAGAPATREEMRVYVVPFDHGLHARPAAQVAAALRPFAAQVHAHRARAQRQRAQHRGADDARRALRRRGAGRATGADAAQALDALGGLLAARSWRSRAGTGGAASGSGAHRGGDREPRASRWDRACHGPRPRSRSRSAARARRTKHKRSKPRWPPWSRPSRRCSARPAAKRTRCSPRTSSSRAIPTCASGPGRTSGAGKALATPGARPRAPPPKCCWRSTTSACASAPPTCATSRTRCCACSPASRRAPRASSRPAPSSSPRTCCHRR